MTDPFSSPQPVLNRGLMWIGTVLIGAGAVLAATGGTLWAAAAASAVRHHVGSSGMPPSELAMHHWRRAKTAARAGADTWRGQVPVPGPRQPAPTRTG